MEISIKSKRISIREELANEIGTVKIYNDLAYSYLITAIIQKPYDKRLLEKALNIYDVLKSQYPQITQYSKDYNFVKQMLDESH